MSLNLDNFDGSDAARETPYILTSPTSIEACRRLGIQVGATASNDWVFVGLLGSVDIDRVDLLPRDLIYHSLEEYEERYCDLPLAHIYRIYEENETRRQETLLRAQEIRYGLKSGIEMVSPGESQVAPRTSGVLVTPQQTRRNQKSIRRHTSAPSVNKSPVRNRVNFDLGGSVSSRSRSSRLLGSSRGSRLEENSDTESAADDGRLRRIIIDDPFLSSRSMPDLSSTRGNLDFRKITAKSAASPRHLCPCHYSSSKADILSDMFRKYDPILNSPDLTSEDRKICERLILKKGKDLEWQWKSQELRKLIENDRSRRFTENEALMATWAERLAAKRRWENEENSRRYLTLQEKAESSRSNLMRYLEDRDRRVCRYLDDLQYGKKKVLIERQKREALRQLEVGKALEKIVEEDRQHRAIMRDKLARRMEEAEIRKRRREHDYFRHVAEMNRLEEVKRALKLESLEQKSRESLEELRRSLEKKEERARRNYLERLRHRNRALSEGGGSRQRAIEKAHAVHESLLRGLEEWHAKVAELQKQSQHRAEVKVREEVRRRRARVAGDRIFREERSSEMLRRVAEEEAMKRKLLKASIETKEEKGERVRREKERRVALSRVRAQRAAELRSQLRETLDPETFDRKVARVEVEMHVLKGKGSLHKGFVSFCPSGSAKLHNGKRCSSCNFGGSGLRGRSAGNINSGSVGSALHTHTLHCYPFKALRSGGVGSYS